ncbi:MAG: dephospho-CoA kinase [Alphaproteobacteria bacterium]|nr:dephospho-CoA kinase [Alphaproteobacteria bacterium]
MRILGLTGSIGMGKSVAANTFRRLGIPVHDADAAVHRLTAPNGRAIPAIARLFPETVTKGVLDRKKLGARVFADKAELRKLEKILHPMVRALQKQFIGANRRKRIVVLDIPLLFEGRNERRCHAVMVVSTSRIIQRQRVMRRSGMTEEKLANILKNQMPDWEKRKRADFVVPTGIGFRSTLRLVRRIAKHLRHGRWPRGRHARNRARHGNHGA